MLVGLRAGEVVSVNLASRFGLVTLGLHLFLQNTLVLLLRLPSSVDLEGRGSIGVRCYHDTVT